jgi:hypothetical protein
VVILLIPLVVVSLEDFFVVVGRRAGLTVVVIRLILLVVVSLEDFFVVVGRRAGFLVVDVLIVDDVDGLVVEIAEVDLIELEAK